MRHFLALLGMAVAAPLGAQDAVPALGTKQAPLVLRGVTVIDVRDGTRRADQMVVIVGNRIRALGARSTVQVPLGAHVVNGEGKYLIPGLWDVHTHAARSADFFYPLFLANGVTGIRDAGSAVPLDTLRLWRQEILAGTRVGPPRQILSGQSIMDRDAACDRHRRQQRGLLQLCVTDAADARHVVDSLEAAGADMIKPRDVRRPAMYFAIAAEARRVGIPFGGHVDAQGLTAQDVSDSGASIVDHLTANGMSVCWAGTPAVEACRPVAERFRRHGTWFVPTLLWTDNGAPVFQRFEKLTAPAFWAGSFLHGNWLRAAAESAGVQIFPSGAASDSAPEKGFAVMRQLGMPLLAGTDVSAPNLHTRLPGFALHAELTAYVTKGLTPLEALQTATLNPAKLLHATDSLGTVEAGKLADLVLLDADPLADITNTTTIHAVIANGRYFDRTALDRLLSEARDNVGAIPADVLAGVHKGTILPVIDVDVDRALQADTRYAMASAAGPLRAWADSLLGPLVAARMPEISWLLPATLHKLAVAGKGKDPADYSRAWPVFSDSGVPDSMRAPLRELASIAGGRVAVVPVKLDLALKADSGIQTGGAGPVCAELYLQLVDLHAARWLWRSFARLPLPGQNLVQGCGDTPTAAVAAAVAAAFRAHHGP